MQNETEYSEYMESESTLYRLRFSVEILDSSYFSYFNEQPCIIYTYSIVTSLMSVSTVGAQPSLTAVRVASQRLPTIQQLHGYRTSGSLVEGTTLCTELGGKPRDRVLFPSITSRRHSADAACNRHDRLSSRPYYSSGGSVRRLPPSEDRGQGCASRAGRGGRLGGCADGLTLRPALVCLGSASERHRRRTSS